MDTGVTVSRTGLTWRMVVWAGFVACCAFAMASDGVPPDVGFAAGPFWVSIYDILIVGAFAFALGDMLRAFTDRTPSATRTVARVLFAYMLYLALIVIPVGMGLGLGLNHVIHGMTVRLVWLLVPTVWALCRDERTMRIAGMVPVIAAAGLAAWGVYFAATGGAGFYYESGDLRFRVLWGGATLLFAWPFALAMSGAVSTRLTVALGGISLVGLALTNHRSGFVAFALVAVFLLVASGRWRRALIWAVPLALAAIIVGLLAESQLQRVFGYTISALLDFTSGNGADRLVRWNLALQSFLSRPFNDYIWSGTYYLVHLQDPYPPHNFVLEIAVNEGVAGLAFYGVVLWTALRAGWRWIRLDAVMRALVGYVIAYLAFSAANATLYQLATAPLLAAAIAGIVVRAVQLRAAGPTIGGPA